MHCHLYVKFIQSHILLHQHVSVSLVITIRVSSYKPIIGPHSESDESSPRTHTFCCKTYVIGPFIRARDEQRAVRRWICSPVPETLNVKQKYKNL